MSIDALALLKGRDLQLPSSLLLRTLEDGVLVHTHQRFGGDLEELGATLRQLLGGALDKHDDPRGVFIIPDVANPEAQSYDGVIEEIGEAGEWAPLVSVEQVPASLVDAPDGSLANMVGQMMGALGGNTIAELMQAVTTGDTTALAAMQDKLVEAMGGQEQLEEFGKQMLGAAQAEAPAAAAAIQAQLATGGLAAPDALGVEAEKPADAGADTEKKSEDK